MSLDKEKFHAVYGAEATPRRVLHGSVEPPAEFQPLYGELNRIVNRVERVSANPARVSASLERMSAGVDHERVMVLPDGAVVKNGAS